jgi:hypothetical protein
MLFELLAIDIGEAAFREFWEVREIMLLAAPQLQLCSIKSFGVSCSLDFQDPIVPHGPDAFVEGPLNETPDSKELSAINGELALGLVGPPVLLLAVFTAVVDRRLV